MKIVLGSVCMLTLLFGAGCSSDSSESVNNTPGADAALDVATDGSAADVNAPQNDSGTKVDAGPAPSTDASDAAVNTETSDGTEAGPEASVEAATDAAPPSDSGHQTTADTGTAADVMAPDASDAAVHNDTGLAVCNTLVNNAPDIQATHIGGTLPTPQGGTIVPGTYYRTATTYYDNGTGGGPYKEMLVISAVSATTYYVQGVMFTQTFTNTVTLGSNGAFQAQTTCPLSQPAEGNGYTATPTELRIYKSSADKEMVYTLQQ